MNDDLRDAFGTIIRYCRNHYRTGAKCRGCQITAWCENRSGYPKDFADKLEEK